MARVRVEPLGIELERARRGDDHAGRARRRLLLAQQCDMQCRCSNCFFRVVEGAPRLSEMGRAERATLLEQRGRRALEQPVRLGCQTSVTGDVVIHKAGRVRRSVA